MTTETPPVQELPTRKEGIAKRLTVSRKILMVVFATTLVGLGLLVFLGLQNQRQHMEDLAIKNNLTISKLMAVQLSGALKWKKEDKIKEVYNDIASADGSPLSALLTFDTEGKPVTDYSAARGEDAGLDELFASRKAEIAKNGFYSENNGSHHIIIVPVLSPKGDAVGTVVFSWSLHRLNSQLSDTLRQQLWISGAALLGIMVLTGFLLSRFIGKPLARLTGAMTALADGDQTVEIDGLTRKDDVGDMSRAVQVFKANAEKVKALEIERQKEAAEKTHREEQRRQEELARADEERKRKEDADAEASAQRNLLIHELAEKLELSINSVAHQISGSAGHMEDKARGMVDSAAETDRHSSTIASAAEQAASNVSGVASAAEELSASLQEIGRQVDVSTSLFKETLQAAQNTDRVVGELSVSAGEIGNVIELINSIAAQTNLLALNATIEAARAGDAGKGFAVVASEVKGLASQTTHATEEITRQIDEMQTATANAVSAVKSIEDMLVRMNETVQVMASAVEEQNSATLEITRNVQQASSNTEEVSRSVQDVAEMASASGNSANQLLGSVSELSEFSAKLQSEVDAVLRDIRGMAS